MSLLSSPAKRTLQAALTAALIGPGVASAYRPFDGTDAAVAEDDVLELELQPIGWEAGAGGRALVSSVVVNWGVTHRLELVLEGGRIAPLGDLGRGKTLRRNAADPFVFLPW